MSYQLPNFKCIVSFALLTTKTFKDKLYSNYKNVYTTVLHSVYIVIIQEI